jgi:serine/threonine-protein kinase PpkA
MKSIVGYKIHKLFAQGGMASIYLAEQDSLKRKVVLKFLNADLDESIKKSFIDEGRIIASLKHPNVITIFDVVHGDENNFISMEYLEGGDLKERLKTRINAYEALSIICKIADALHFIHKQGVIHGDIKPANILFRRNNTPILTDFGVSRRTKNSEIHAGEQNPSFLYASPIYASPELIQGKPFDHRVDVYSLGIMMYEMLVGEKPYTGETEIQAIANSIQAPIPKLPKPFYKLQPLLESLLAKDPDERLSNPHLVVHLINKYLKDHPELKTGRPKKKIIKNHLIEQYVAAEKKKKVKTAVSTSVVLLSIALFLSVGLWFSQQEERSLEEKQGNQVSNKGVDRVPSSSPVQVANTEFLVVSKTNTAKNILQEKKEIVDTTSSISPLQSSSGSILIDKTTQSEEIEALKHEHERQLSQQNSEESRLEIERLKQEREEQLKEELKQETIQDLLTNGQESIDKYHLTSPKNDNALYYFHQILEIDPENEDAKKGVEQVVTKYILLVKAKISKEKYKDAQKFIKKGLSLDPKNHSLHKFQNFIDMIPKKEIAKLLIQAKKSFVKKNLINPKNNNALYYYQKIFTIEKENTEAQKGIKKIIEQYIIWAQKKVDKKQYKEAKPDINNGLSLDPSNSKLLSLKKKVDYETDPSRFVNKLKGFFGG